MSDHITYAWHVATEELVGRMIAAEKRVKELEAKSLEDSAEISGLQNTVIRQGELLTGVVNAIRGEPPHDTLRSHHDAPQLAERMKAENAELRKFIEAKMHHLPIEDQHVASVMIQQSDDEGEA